MNEQDIKYMQQALELAKYAREINEVPVGAVVVLDNQIIARGHNMPITNHSPVAHAEVVALGRAGKFLENYRVLGASLYVTLEPCMMCYGAMVHARIARCVFAASDSKSGVVSQGVVDLAEQYINHKVAIEGGVLAEESSLLLKNFFKQKR